MNAADVIIAVVRWWFIAGGVVAAFFLTAGIDRIDDDARGAYVFRPLLVPGVLLIWPLVLWRYWLLTSGRAQETTRFRVVRAAHGKVAVALAVSIVLIVALGLIKRQSWPAEFTPVRISETGEAGQ